MQKMNALPNFLPQETDIKRNDSSSLDDVNQKDKGFSNLVDQHVKTKEAAESKRERAEHERNIRSRKAASSDSYKNDNVADNDKSIENDKKQKQEISSASKAKLENNNNQQSKIDETETTENTVESLNKEQASEKINTKDNDLVNKADGNEGDRSLKDNEAMLASEKFISLLYNSDQALAESKSKNISNEQPGADNTETQLLSRFDAETKKAQQEATKNEELTGINNKDSALIKNNSDVAVEHKLKVFSDKTSNVELLTDKERLQRYQQQLQLKDSQGLSEKGLSEFNLKEQGINKSSLIGESIAKSTSLPTEPKVGLADETLMAEDLTFENTVVKTDKNNKLSAIAELKAKLGNDSIGSVNADNIEKLTKVLADETVVNSNAINEAGKNQQIEQSSLSNKSVDGNADKNSKLDKAHNISSLTNSNVLLKDSTLIDADELTEAKDALLKPQKLSPQLAASLMAEKTPQQVNNKQENLIQKINDSTKLDLVDNSSGSNSSKESIDKENEFSLAESVLSSIAKEGTSSTKSVSNQNQSDNISRAFTELNTQATQVKQVSDAYSNYQNSEALNHNVATDTAQIQKNNVQLHQETIAIFRKDFSEAVKDKVMLMVSQKLQQFDITLDPPEFGNMQIRVNLQGEQAAVNFVVQNQQAKDALEQNMHKLRDMLAEQGVDVGDANVEQQSQQNTEEEQKDQQSSTRALNNDVDKESKLHVLSGNLFNSSATGVDYYA